MVSRHELPDGAKRFGEHGVLGGLYEPLIGVEVVFLVHVGAVEGDAQVPLDLLPKCVGEKLKLDLLGCVGVECEFDEASVERSFLFFVVCIRLVVLDLFMVG